MLEPSGLEFLKNYAAICFEAICQHTTGYWKTSKSSDPEKQMEAKFQFGEPGNFAKSLVPKIVQK